MMTNQTITTRTPSHTAYAVKPTTWTGKPGKIEVGAAWEHSDGQGFFLILNLLGQDVRVNIRRNMPERE